MINLYKTDNCVGNNHWPEHAAENSVDDKTDTSYQIDNPDLG